MGKTKKDVLIVGLALFASYFGAGNLIFPPLLGLISGNEWNLGALAFIFSAVFMPVLALYIISKAGGSVEELTKKIHPNFHKALLIVIMLLAGLVAIPRTGAVAYELGLSAVLPNFPAQAFILIYFFIAFYFSVDVNKMINKVAKYLTPALVIILIGIIIKGIISPIGVSAPAKESGIFVKNFLGGYQTGDLIVSYLLGSVIIGDIIRRGYKTDRERNSIVLGAGFVAFILLFIIYAGLLYLGATVSSLFTPDIDRSRLLLSIVEELLGNFGLIALGIAVVLACITTAIGQITSIADFLKETTNGKISHKKGAIISSVISAGIALLGVEKIVFITTPIFLAVYPNLIVLSVLGIFSKFSISKTCYRFTVFFTLVISLLESFTSLFKVSFIVDFINSIPFSEHGFAWIIPAISGFVIGIIFDSLSKKKGEKICRITE